MVETTHKLFESAVSQELYLAFHSSDLPEALIYRRKLEPEFDFQIGHHVTNGRSA